MTLSERKVLAVFHAAGAGIGLFMFPWSSASTSSLGRVSMLLFGAFLAASALTTYFVAAGGARGRTWSIGLLLIQIPQISTSALSFILFSPLSAAASLTGGFEASFAVELAGHIDVRGPGEIGTTTLGVNLAAVLLLWLWLRAPKPAPAPPTSGGLVSR